MKVVIIQHVEYESPGYFMDIFESLNADIHIITQYKPHKKVAPEFDTLLIMGGPMGIFDSEAYPWLEEEKRIIKDAINSGKRVIGVCLGAQLIADSLGAEVYRNNEKEVGWYPVWKTHNGILNFLPDIATVFHWHSDTFDLPQDCISFYSSEVTKNQAFLYNRRVLGIQFHLEMDEKDAEELYKYSFKKTGGDKFVMDKREGINSFKKYSASNKRMLKNLINWLVNF